MRSSHILIVILLLAAALRLWGLGTESLWLDEGITAHRTGISFGQLVRDFRGETQTILYYLGENAWCAVAGRSEAALRFPSLVFGVLTVWAVFLFARQVFSPAAALWAAFLLAINPFAIFYSQEARPYALLLLTAVLSLYFLLRFLRSPGKGAAWGYMISAAIALYTHPLGPLLLLVHGALILLFREHAEWRQVRRTLGLIAATFVLYLPQLAFMWTAVVGKAKGTGSASWIPVPVLRDFAETFRQYFMNPYLAYFALALLILALILFVRRGRADNRGLFLCLALGFAFAPLLWIASYVLTPLYVHRFTIPALVALLLILGWVLASLKLRWRMAALLIYLLLTAPALFAYYTKADKEPWRRTAELVREQVRPGDAIVLNASYTRSAFEYYFPAMPGVAVIAPWSLDEIPAALDSARNVIFVRAYATSSKRRAVTDSLNFRVARGRRIGPNVRVNDLAPQNPWGYWIADISVTRYDREP
jgi:mannosyltransferase